MNEESPIKYIYCVRHGESESNAGAVRQGPETPLTEKGMEQAEVVGKRLKNLPVEVLIASSMVRARQTAEIISGHIEKPLEFTDLAIERQMPSVVYWKHREDPETNVLIDKLKEAFEVPGWRHSDEENFDDLRARAQKALDFLAARPETHIALVTHAHFLITLLSVAALGDALTGAVYRKMIESFRHENTGITILEYHSGVAYPWRIVTWNDHAHLG
ncbi:MAG: histidine phosphatase family protein [Patescibacteria group bacterium]